MKNVLTPLAKIVLVPLGLLAAASATDAAIQKKIFDSGTTLVFSKEETDIIKIVKSLENTGLLLKSVIETVENEVKEQKGGFFLGMLSTTLGVSLLGNMLAGEGLVRGGNGVIWAGEGTNRDVVEQNV